MIQPTVYRPLDRGRREFRLLRIHSENTIENTIELTLEHAFLDNASTYGALSYTWGDVGNEIPVVINGIPTPTRRNLYAALLQLRKRKLDYWIWIDAICIDQSNDEEKSWQVSEMRSIYSQADRIYSWLGFSADDSECAIQLLEIIACEVGSVGMSKEDVMSANYWKNTDADRCWSELWRALCLRVMAYEDLQSKCAPDYHCRGAAAIEKLLSRDYFSRIWIVQEFGLSKRCQLMCGEDLIELDTLDIAIEMIFAIWSCQDHLFPEYPRLGFFYPFNGTCSDSLPRVVRSATVSGEPPTLFSILDTGVNKLGKATYAASDPRDIIFGLLGCAVDINTLGLQADYTKNTAQVFTEATRAFLERDEDYYLGRCNFPKDSPGLPSWVPDWKRVGEFGFLDYPLNARSLFKAGNGLGEPPVTGKSVPWNILRVYGCQVDVITAIMKPSDDSKPTLYMKNPEHEVIDPDPPAMVAHVLGFLGQHNLNNLGEDAVWRTLILDEQLPSQPTTPIWLSLASRVFVTNSWGLDELTAEQKAYIQNFTPEGTVAEFKKRCFSQMAVAFRHRAVFQTSSGRIGVGSDVMMSVGDIVTILCDNDTPIILRHHGEGLHLYVGEAYVDGIMHGEYFDTNREAVFFDLV